MRSFAISWSVCEGEPCGWSRRWIREPVSLLWFTRAKHFWVPSWLNGPVSINKMGARLAVLIETVTNVTLRGLSSRVFEINLETGDMVIYDFWLAGLGFGEGGVVVRWLMTRGWQHFRNWGGGGGVRNCFSEFGIRKTGPKENSSSLKNALWKLVLLQNVLGKFVRKFTARIFWQNNDQCRHFIVAVYSKPMSLSWMRWQSQVDIAGD